MKSPINPIQTRWNWLGFLALAGKFDTSVRRLKFRVLGCVTVSTVCLSGCLTPGPMDALTKKLLPSQYEKVETGPRKLHTRRFPEASQTSSPPEDDQVFANSTDLDEANETIPRQP